MSQENRASAVASTNIPSRWVPVAIPNAIGQVGAYLFYAYYAQTLVGAPDEGAPRADALSFLRAAPMVLGAVHMAWLWLWFRPWGRVRAALRQGKNALELDLEDVRKTLTVPRKGAASTLVVWGVAAVAWLPYGVHVAGELNTVIIDGALLGVCTGVLAATVTFYALSSVSARFVMPVLVPDGNLRRLRPLWLMRAWHHIALLALNASVIGPFATRLLLETSSEPQRAMLGLNVVMFAVAGIQVFGVLRSISTTTGHLASKMSAVRRGDLSVTAQVRDLDTFGQICGDFNEMVEGLRQRELIRETFGRYVTQQVADEILAGSVQLGGDLKTATVLFSDIRGFTTLSEKMSPEEVVAFLNRYFDSMVDCVFEHGGILDKFIGDAVMAVFGVPMGLGSAKDDARAAVDCALAMSKRLDALNAQAPAGTPKIEIGIGLHTGELVAGNIGSQKRMEYTVIGDTVNLTSRLESMTKSLGKRILLTETTAAYCEGTHLCEPLDTLPVRGRDEPVRVYSVRRKSE